MNHPETDPQADSDGPTDLAAAWRGVVDDLQAYQRAWLRSSEPVTLHESTAIIAVPNDFTRGQLEGRLRAQLEDALTVAFGREIRIAVTVNQALDTGDLPETDDRVDESTRRSGDMSTKSFGGSDGSAAPLPEKPAPATSGATSLETRLNT